MAKTNTLVFFLSTVGHSVFGVKNAHLTPVRAMRCTSPLRPSTNGMVSYRAVFVRCLFLTFKRTARLVSLNLTANNFVD